MEDWTRNFGHVRDLFSLELHNIDVIRLRCLPSWRARPAGQMCASEDPKSADVFTLRVDRKGFHLIGTVCQNRQKPLHPLSVLLKRFNFSQRLCLRDKRCVRAAIGTASGHPLPVSHAAKNAAAVSVVDAIS